jgi:hypothetical protein
MLDKPQQRSLREELERRAQMAEAVGDPAASFLRGLVLRCDIEQQRDDRVEEMLETAERIAGGAIDRQVVQRFWLYGLAGTGLATLLVVGGIAYGVHLYNSAWNEGYSTRVTEVQHAVDGLQAAATQHGPEGAEDWLHLMQYNDIKRATRQSCSQQDGHPWCAFDLWIAPPPSPGEQTAQEAQTSLPAPIKTIPRKPQ